MAEQDAGETRSFPQTRWSLIGRAAGASGGPSASQHALSELLTRYLPAMRAHLRSNRRIRADEVDDLLQAFIASKVLEQNLLAAAEQSRGRFRTFLVTSLDNFVLNTLRDRSAAKRTPAQGALQSLTEIQDVCDPAGAPTVDPFDLVWAQEVIREAMLRTQAECEMASRADLWALFDARVATPMLEGGEPAPYEQLIKQLKFDSPSQATNALVTAKRMFARMLRSVVSDYAPGDAEVDEEIRDLRRILEQARL
jgi:hypothetical protein